MSWIAGFDGGDKQDFKINFKRKDDDEWTYVHVLSDGTEKGAQIHYKLSDLFSQTTYNVTLVASNEHGNSSTSLQFTTKGNVL